MVRKKVMLIIRDGWGDGPAHAQNGGTWDRLSPQGGRKGRDYKLYSLWRFDKRPLRPGLFKQKFQKNIRYGYI